MTCRRFSLSLLLAGVSLMGVGSEAGLAKPVARGDGGVSVTARADETARVEAAVRELGAKFPSYPAAAFLAEIAANRAKGLSRALLQKMLVPEKRRGSKRRRVPTWTVLYRAR